MYEEERVWAKWVLKRKSSEPDKRLAKAFLELYDDKYPEPPQLTEEELLEALDWDNPPAQAPLSRPRPPVGRLDAGLLG